ncbi:MBL fold metallo-hydrolase [Streptomyces sp. TE33382]
MHLGTAHTTNDTVVWLPDQRVLFTGDVVMSGATPFCLTGSVAGSISVIERLRALSPRIVVPATARSAAPNSSTPRSPSCATSSVWPPTASPRDSPRSPSHARRTRPRSPTSWTANAWYPTCTEPAPRPTARRRATPWTSGNCSPRWSTSTAACPTARPDPPAPAPATEGAPTVPRT